jgi:hypothetical protein
LPCIGEKRAEFTDVDEDESETLPLPWPGDEPEPQLGGDADEEGTTESSTQPLAWDDTDMVFQPTSGDVSMVETAKHPVEIPTSDDEDKLQRSLVDSCSSSSSPPSSPMLPSVGPKAALSEAAFGRRSDERTPTRTPRMRLVDLTSASLRAGSNPVLAPRGTSPRFAAVVAALHKEERRQNSGMQLRLDRHFTRRVPPPELVPDELSADEMSDGFETQPLPWADQPPAPRPVALPCRPPPTLSPSTSVSLPSDSMDGIQTPVRDFIRDL